MPLSNPDPHFEARFYIDKENANSDTTIIIGGGSIGLWTAYYLAKGQIASNQEVNIVVLEAKHQVFGSASGKNTGLIHYQHGYHYDGPPRGSKHKVGVSSRSQCAMKEDEVLRELGKYSFDLWKEVHQKKWREQLNWRDDGILSATYDENAEKSESERLQPEWAILPLGASVTEGRHLGDDRALVEPAMVGTWLLEICKAMKVRILTSHLVLSVDLDSEGELDFVRVREIKTTGGDNYLGFPCGKLLLAAGPWTPTLFHDLFPKSNLEVEEVLDWDDWYQFNSHTSNVFLRGKKNTVYLYHEEPEYAAKNEGLEHFPETELVCHGSSVWMTLRSRCELKHVSLPGADESTTMDTTIDGRILGPYDLRDRFLEESLKLNFVPEKVRNRVFRPVTHWGRPMMCELEVKQPQGSKKVSETETKSPKQASGGKNVAWGLPESSKAKSLADKVGGGVNQLKTKVFFCWGHGDYGLSMGPGSGKLMSQLMRGEKTDIDLSPFGYPEVPPPPAAGDTTGTD